MRRRRVGFAVVAVTAAMAVLPASASASPTCPEGQVNPGDVNQALRDVFTKAGLAELGNDLNSKLGSLRRLDGKVKAGKVCEQLPD